MIATALGIAGAAGVASWLGAATMLPKSQLLGRTFVGTPGRGTRLALTYDDGPNDPYTQQLLDVLARHNVHATFFMIGSYVAKSPGIARAVRDAGHEIGNHTWAHPNLIWCSSARVRDELAQTSKALNDAIGPHSNFFRPPFGGRRPASLRAAKRAGLSPILWSVTGFDWSLPTAEAIEQKVWTQITGGDVILLHDGSHRGLGWDRSNTVRATDALIRKAKDNGYSFCTVGDMMNSSEPSPGITP